MIISEVNMLNTMLPKENKIPPGEEPLIKPVGPSERIDKKPDMTSPEEAEKKRQLRQLGKTAGEIDKYDGGEVGDENAVYDGKEVYNKEGEVETLGDSRGNIIDTKA